MKLNPDSFHLRLFFIFFSRDGNNSFYFCNPGITLLLTFYKKQVFGLDALKIDPVCFWTLDGRGKLILESCICFTPLRLVSLAATGSTRMI